MLRSCALTRTIGNRDQDCQPGSAFWSLVGFRSNIGRCSGKYLPRRFSGHRRGCGREPRALLGLNARPSGKGADRTHCCGKPDSAGALPRLFGSLFQFRPWRGWSISRGSIPLHQRRYPGDRSCDPPSVILVEPLQDALRIVLEIEVGEALPEAVMTTRLSRLLDLPRRRKSARIGHERSRTQREQKCKVDTVHKLI